MKVFFSKGWQELPLVALPAQEKIAFPFKRISAAVGATKVVFQKKICFENKEIITVENFN
jgi:hypothetical protein